MIKKLYWKHKVQSLLDINIREGIVDDFAYHDSKLYLIYKNKNKIIDMADYKQVRSFKAAIVYAIYEIKGVDW